MKDRILLPLIILSFSIGSAQTTNSNQKTTPSTNPPVFKNALDSFSYAMGLSIGNFCKLNGINNINTTLLVKGANAGSGTDKALMSEKEMNTVIGSYISRMKTQQATAGKVAGQKFLELNAKKPGVVILASGLQYLVLKTGTDTTRPKLTDKIKCHYHGTLIDGKVFESSVERGQPLEFYVNEVIPGWVEAFQLMTVGSKWRLFVPADLAYGDVQAGPSIPPGSTLIFDVELLAIVK